MRKIAILFESLFSNCVGGEILVSGVGFDNTKYSTKTCHSVESHDIVSVAYIGARLLIGISGDF